MTLAPASAAFTSVDHGADTTDRATSIATVREHPLVTLERLAEAELRALMTPAPAAASHDAAVAALLGWDLGLAGDELP